MPIVFNLLCLPLAFIYGALAEWILHKYILHGLGKRKGNLFSFHWHIHHKTCRKNRNYDMNYLKSPRPPVVQKEKLSLVLLVVVHLPLLFVVPYFFFGLMAFAFRYFYYHRRSHIDIKWGRKNIPWHYDHHMGKNQDANYGVTFEWVDKLFKTRIKYFKEEQK